MANGGNKYGTVARGVEFSTENVFRINFRCFVSPVAFTGSQQNPNVTNIPESLLLLKLKFKKEHKTETT